MVHSKMQSTKMKLKGVSVGARYYSANCSVAFEEGGRGFGVVVRYQTIDRASGTVFIPLQELRDGGGTVGSPFRESKTICFFVPFNEHSNAPCLTISILRAHGRGKWRIAIRFKNLEEDVIFRRQLSELLGQTSIPLFRSIYYQSIPTQIVREPILERFMKCVAKGAERRDEGEYWKYYDGLWKQMEQETKRDRRIRANRVTRYPEMAGLGETIAEEAWACTEYGLRGLENRPPDNSVVLEAVHLGAAITLLNREKPLPREIAKWYLRSLESNQVTVLEPEHNKTETIEKLSERAPPLDGLLDKKLCLIPVPLEVKKSSTVFKWCICAIFNPSCYYIGCGRGTQSGQKTCIYILGCNEVADAQDMLVAVENWLSMQCRNGNVVNEKGNVDAYRAFLSRESIPSILFFVFLSCWLSHSFSCQQTNPSTQKQMWITRKERYATMVTRCAYMLAP